MLRDLTAAEKLTLESLVDAASLQGVLVALAEIAGEKAEHIATNWQDTRLAKDWANAANAIERAVPKALNL